MNIDESLSNKKHSKDDGDTNEETQNEDDDLNQHKDSFDDWTEEDQSGYEATVSSLKIYYERLNVDSQKSSSTFTKDRKEYLLIMLQRKIGKLSEESLNKLHYDFGWCNNYIDTARIISEE